MRDDLSHYGTPRHSGRYPWGSGEDPQQRNRSFLGHVEEMKKKGLSEKEIADGLGMTTTQLRAKKSIAKAEQRKADYAQAVKWKEKGMSNVEIGKRLGGMNESSVRALLNPAIQERSETANATANMLKESIDKKGYIDVGIGTERYMGVNRTKLNTSIAMLQEEGYVVSYIKVEQLGTGKETSVKVLSKPNKKEHVEVFKLMNDGLSEDDIAKKMNISVEDVKKAQKEVYADVYRNKDNIKMVTDYSEDGGRTFLGLEPIKSVSSDRIHIRYHEDGGSDKDGVIELRRGVDDLSLGKSKYAQVRVGVDDKHYLKGMAMYTDDIPKGKDIIYNTNKTKDVPPEKVFKTMSADLNDPKARSIMELNISKDEKENLLKKGVNDGSIKPDPDNPFGATIKAGGQSHYKDKNGKDQLSSINIVNEEGDWSKWSKTLSSQVLSKQSPALAKKQLEKAFDAKQQEFDEIMTLTNPAVRKKLLESFSDDCDSSAVHLKAAALPRQGSHVLLPFPDMKENEIYAPNYENGEKVVLIRYPHGGIFEIPELTVNNKHKGARATIDQAKDAVGVNSKVAERLSGADFDGDTALVIPNPAKGGIKTSAPLKGLMNFDPKIAYKGYEGMPVISARTKQMKMGEVSNLITDMTIKKANDAEIAAAVRHSMVVIDAEKHKLNYKQSEIDNGIAALKKKYQGSARSGAATLVSRASSQARVGTRKLKTNIKKMTKEEQEAYLSGKKVYEYTNDTYIKRTKLKDGTIKETPILRTVSSTKMAEVDDAFKLSSGTVMENVYATHANKLKALGNQSRKEYIGTKPVNYSPSAKKAYESQVNSLQAQLNVALKNAPLERQAQILANSVVSAKKAANPNMENDELKKIKNQALAEARSRTGAGKTRVVISPLEWEAIQAGAISNNVLMQILDNTDLDHVKLLATPRTNKELSAGKQERIKQMIASGRTQAEIASALGISTSVVNKVLQ